MGTLQEIALLAPRSEIVFEYSVPEEQLDGAERQYIAWRKERNRKRGEPWIGFFDPHTDSDTHAELRVYGGNRAEPGEDQQSVLRGPVGWSIALPRPIIW